MKAPFYLVVILAVSLLFADIISAQNSSISFESAPHAKPEKKRRLKKITTEFEAASAFESDNKLGLIEEANVRNKTTATVKFGKYVTHISGELTAATKFDPHHAVGVFGIGIARNFHSFGVSLENKFYFKHNQRFGTLAVEINKVYHLAEEVELKPFTTVSGYYALDGSQNDVSNGLTWHNGVVFDSKLGKGKFEAKAQLIADSGALHKGKRIAGNFEVKYLHPIPRTRTFAGPKFELTTFPYVGHGNHLEKRNVFVFGLVMKMM